MTDLLQLLIRNGTYGRLHGFPEVCKDARVNRICLGELSNGPCEIAHLSRVDNRDWQASLHQRVGCCILMPASRLKNDQLRRPPGQRLYQLLNSCVVVVNAQRFACRPNCDIQAPLRYVDANPDCTHSPVLWSVMSTLHSRLPDTGSVGPGIHSSSKGSVVAT